MNYEDVVRGVHQRYGTTTPPADQERAQIIQRNRAMFPEAVRAAERMLQKNERSQEAEKCPLCGGTSWADVGELIDGYHFVTPCRCAEASAAKRKMEESGLSQFMKDRTFDTFRIAKPFQQEMARTAAAFVQDYLNADPFKPRLWLFLGGQSGSGKTHLCTAVLNQLLNESIPCLYVSWLEESRRLKSRINETDYGEMIGKMLHTPVLYIDDLFKSKDKTPPTDADIKVAFDIINGRYVKGNATIISSEWTLPELIAQDEAIGSRIKERSTSYALSISQDSTKNYRLNA
ncbi:MAG: hypothetical protein E7329_04225 [Clostridiales bacterium]|nr:hypothetical protein [Clostridiales bacterium]